MVRRDFIQRLAVGGAGSLAAGSSHAGESKSVTYQIKGFTCITCAVGLEVMLRDHKGVAQAKASYPEKRVVVGFDPAVTNEEAIRQYIQKTTGFTAIIKR